MVRIYEKKHHSPHKRTAIATAYQKGVPAKAVAAEHGVSPDAVYAIARRYQNQISGRSQPGRGRKFKLDERYIRRILREIDQNPFISNKELIENCALPVTEQTLVTTLKKRGIQHRQALRRPKLSDTIAQKRLEFAQKHLNKPLEYWKRFVFSDETTVVRGQGERQAWVFCRAVPLIPSLSLDDSNNTKGERLDPKHVQPRITHTRHSQMFWGAFSFDRRTALAPLMGDPDSRRGGVTGRIIRNCLEDQLPTICEPSSIFLQDNAPTHTANIVQSWLQEWAQENGVELVDWPPYSPDLNPIENLWKLLKEGICKRYPELGSLPKNEEAWDRLVRAAIEVWEDLEKDLERLVSSMDRRMAAVVRANGWYTKY